MKNFNFNIDDLYKHFKFHNSGIDKNGVTWITTLCKTDKPSSYNKIMFDFGYKTIEILILYFEYLEEFEICADLKKRIEKHKEITV